MHPSPITYSCHPKSYAVCYAMDVLCNFHFRCDDQRESLGIPEMLRSLAFENINVRQGTGFRLSTTDSADELDLGPVMYFVLRRWLDTGTGWDSRNAVCGPW
jgi:hypothetical protein